jgi:hypothetical protein
MDEIETELNSAPRALFLKKLCSSQWKFIFVFPTFLSNQAAIAESRMVVKFCKLNCFVGE